jgi:hypothetical protein
MKLAYATVIGLLLLGAPSARAECTVADIPSDGVTGFQEAVVSVADLSAAVSTWREVGAFEVICRGKAGPAMAEFWGLPQDADIDQVVLRKPGAGRGFIRLVAFNGVKQVQIRSNGMPWDAGGIFDLYMYVDDVHAVFAQLRARGWQAYADPVTYTLGPFTVTEIMARGPDGEVLCLMQRDAPPYDKAQFSLVPARPGAAAPGFGWPFNAALIFADFAPGARLFGDILGWQMHLSGDNTSKPPGDNPLGLPRNIAQTTSRKFAAYAPHPTDRNGSIQVLANVGLEGRDFSARAVPPNLGLLALRVPVADLKVFADDFTARGGVIATPRRTLALAPYGKVDILAVTAANGARIEFFAPE